MFVTVAKEIHVGEGNPRDSDRQKQVYKTDESVSLNASSGM